MPITQQLSNYQRGISMLDKNIEPAMRFINDILRNEEVDGEKVKREDRKWACEIIIKKAFPDKHEAKDTTERPALYNTLIQYLDGGKKD